MKAKTTRSSRRSRREEALLPHELGTHLFALIRRRLVEQRQPARPPVTQLTFAFE